MGLNGSGKTTIIECLKYVTTGDLPPNSKGGAFIHDPKMCGEKEVLAQVKLSFKSLNGAKMVCTRSLQLTVKKTARQQKTLEGQLLVVRNGERSTLSSRCAELDLLMPQYLGVSKAVLEYVIFCHQDESLWPLSEPAVLKKRFDEIFEALKYTKAIDNIKVLRKKQNDELGKLKILLEQYRTDKDRGEKAKRRSDELHEDIETMRVKVGELTAEMKTVSNEQAKIYAAAQGFEKTIATLNSKSQEAATRSTHMEEFAQSMQQLEESDEELEDMLRQYSKQLDTYTQHINRKREELTSTKSELESVRSQLGEKMTEEGRIQAEQTAHETQLKERENLIKEFCIKLNLKGFDGELDGVRIDDFMSKVSRLSRDQNLILERIKHENEDKIGKAQKALGGLQNKTSSLKQSQEFSRSAIGDADGKIRSLELELRKVGVSSGQEAFVKEDVTKKEKRFEDAKAEAENDQYDRTLQLQNQALREVEGKIDSIIEELDGATKNSSNRAQLSILKQSLESRQNAFDTLIATKSDKFKDVIGLQWSLENLDQDLHTILEDQDDELQEAIRKRDAVNIRLSESATELNISKDMLKKMQKEATDCETEVVQSWEPDPQGSINKVTEFPRIVKEIEEDQRLQKTGEIWMSYLRDAIRFSQDHNACKLCRRKFDEHDHRDRDTFVTRYQSQLEKQMKKANDEYLKDLENNMQMLESARASYNTYMRLTGQEIPALEIKLRDYEATKKKLVEEYGKLEKTVSIKSQKHAEAQSLKTAVTDIVRYKLEIENIDQEIQDLASSTMDVGVTRTIEEMKEERVSLSNKARSIRSQIREMESDRETRRQNIVVLERQVNEARRKLNDLTLKLMESRTISGRIAEYKEARSKQLSEIDNLQQQIEALLPNTMAAEAKLKDTIEECSEKEKLQQREATKFAQSDLHLKTIHHRIQEYLDAGGPDRLNRCRNQLWDLQQIVKALGNKVTATSEEINKLEMDYANAGTTQRVITENLRFRKGQEELKTLEQEIKQLRSLNAEAQRDRFLRDTQLLADRQMRLSTEKSALAGEMRSKDKQLEQLINDFATDYADAKDKYKETLAKVQTTTSAMSDLGKYGAALDKAVMKYHSLKMEEINRIIEELWKSTYRGTDVDAILIRSDNESGKGNRSYNYRVCMVKQDAEMDMRGRCSAGQKVLASIIIRLALAECFGVNCGLIALDEPTTNLDQDNVRSLAKSLHDIIKARQAQSNFQLIVITHDEEFLKEMNCQEYCDTYFRISRNDRQKSIIERQSIMEVI